MKLDILLDKKCSVLLLPPFSCPQLPVTTVPGGSEVKASACNVGDLVRSLGREDPLEKEMATHSSILPGEFHGRRSLVGYSPRGHKESDMTERLQWFIHFSHHFKEPAFSFIDP